MTSVELRGVTKSFGSTKVIERIDLTVEKGEFVAFVGPSGSGKSTLLRMIAGLETVTGGDILVDGEDVTFAEPSDRGIAMVFQSYALYPHMNVYDNIAFNLRLSKFSKAEVDTQVKEAARILRLEALLARSPAQLSDGQRQRVAIGRAIVRHPKVLLFDEPLSAVVLPIFLEMNLLGLNNTYTGLILASGFFPLGVYLTYVYFSTSLPSGVMDSARVDGCNRFQLFSRIGLPLARPIVALVAFFSFLAIWSNYFLAFVLLSNDKLYNLPVGLTAVVSSSGVLSNLPANDVPIKKPEVILAAIIVDLPVLLIFIIAQRFVRSGLLSGAEKG